MAADTTDARVSGHEKARERARQRSFLGAGRRVNRFAKPAVSQVSEWRDRIRVKDLYYANLTSTKPLLRYRERPSRRSARITLRFSVKLPEWLFVASTRRPPLFHTCAAWLLPTSALPFVA